MTLSFGGGGANPVRDHMIATLGVIGALLCINICSIGTECDAIRPAMQYKCCVRQDACCVSSSGGGVVGVMERVEAAVAGSTPKLNEPNSPKITLIALNARITFECEK